MQTLANKKEKLEAIAASARKLLIESVYTAKAGHIGGPLSAMDMLVALFFEIMNIRPEEPNWEERDRFVLSKGHSALGLYVVMALRGFLSIEELKSFDQFGTRLQGHPDMNLLPGIDMSTGSLGQGISAAVGMALGAKVQKRLFTTFCMVGDGELQEGQVWEAADIAYRYRLNNLVVLMDFNRLQQYGWRGQSDDRSSPVEAPERKWKAFGWNVLSIDGHSFSEIIEACQQAKSQQDLPTAIVAYTTKGKGVSFIENDFSWHARVPTGEELRRAIEELRVESEKW